MEENYEILLEEKPAGRIQLLRQGLYLKCYCSCKGDRNKIYRIIACWDNDWENMGILVPDGDYLVLHKSIPVKRFAQNVPTFLMIPFDTDIEQYLKTSKETSETTYFATETEIPEPEITPSSGNDHVMIEDTTAQAESQPCIPIVPDKPFDRLDCLEHAKFAIVDGNPMAIIGSDDIQNSSDNPTGQWSDPSTSA